MNKGEKTQSTSEVQYETLEWQQETQASGQESEKTKPSSKLVGKERLIDTMLVVSRHKYESVMVGDNIEIVVNGISGKKVSLGIIAPDSVKVHRKEIFLAERRKQQIQSVKKLCKLESDNIRRQVI